MVDVIGKTVVNAMKKMIGAVEDDNLERVSPSTSSSRMAEQLRPLRRDACGGGLRRPSADRAV
eukprot:10790139-Heterocapsa_arctica.AAC.1